ncbi:MAG: hypothetical protein EZS28_036413, partial [Streblomastix strix]
DGLNAVGGGGCLVQDNELIKFQYARINCSVEINREVLSDVEGQKDIVDLDGQCGGGICDQAMAGKKGDVGDLLQDQRVVEELGNRALDEAYTWIRQLDGRLIKQIGEKWGLLNRLTGSRSSVGGAEDESVDRRLRDQVEYAVESVLQPVTGQGSSCGQRVQSSMDRLELVSASSDRKDNEDISKDGEGQGISGDCGSDVERIVMDELSESDVSEESGTRIGGADPEAGKVNGRQSTSETTTRKNGRSSNDKHSKGDDLFRSMAGFIGLEDDTLVNLIGSLGGENWRKRRVGLHLFGEYVEERGLMLEDILGKKADVVLANALTWRVAKGDIKAKEDLRKIKTPVDMALGMFASSGNVLQSPIVMAVARNLELERGGNAKYPTVWRIGRQFDYIPETGLGKGRILMR